MDIQKQITFPLTDHLQMCSLKNTTTSLTVILATSVKLRTISERKMMVKFIYMSPWLSSIDIYQSRSLFFLRVQSSLRRVSGKVRAFIVDSSGYLETSFSSSK